MALRKCTGLATGAALNLLSTAWVPALLPNGTVKTLSLREIPASGALRVQHPRADFSALITELVVSLFQTLAAPATVAARNRMLSEPSSVDWSQFTDQHAAFEVLGDGPRFLQAPEVLGKDLVPVSALLFEAPGDKTVRENRDHQYRREAFGHMCPRCAAVGLFLTQSHTRQNGAGYYTGPRGGSVMTVLVEGASLWETVVLNLLPQPQFQAKHADAEAPVGVYPWMAGKEAFTLTALRPEHYGAHGVLWWTPVGIRLATEANESGQACSECGDAAPTLVSGLYRAPAKARVPAFLKHPLTCYKPHPKEEGAELPMLVPPKPLTLEDWLALTLGTTSLGALPALTLLSSRQAERTHLRAFGPQMHIASLMSWFDETAPVFVCEDPQEAEGIKSVARALLKTMQEVQPVLWKALRELKVRAGTQPVPLRMQADSILAQFQVHARQALLVALRQFDADLGALPLQAHTDFQQSLVSRARSLFNDNLVISVQDIEQTRAVLARKNTFNRALAGIAAA